ncbi:MAG: 3'-5' exonuclease [Oligoflexia bacterium]|nr:3'-5' exonuclease [Oligoflexia bacterium]
MRWTDCRIVAFDTETTGLWPFDGDRIIEFGAVELQVGPDLRVVDAQRHDFLINPGIPIPRQSSKISGITDDKVADAPAFQERADTVRKLLSDAIVVAHNLPFDLAFVRRELEEAGKTWPATRAEVDTLPLSQRLLSHMRQHKLGMVCKELGVPLVDAHRASNDAEACGRAFVELARRHHAPEDLDDMVRWADAINPPPATGHLRLGDHGAPIFLDGPYKGQTVEAHPDYLQWMTMAIVRHGQGWQARYPEALREWASRWLRARAAGRIQASARGGNASDWSLDPAPWRSPGRTP